MVFAASGTEIPAASANVIACAVTSFKASALSNKSGLALATKRKASATCDAESVVTEPSSLAAPEKNWRSFPVAPVIAERSAIDCSKVRNCFPSTATEAPRAINGLARKAEFNPCILAVAPEVAAAKPFIPVAPEAPLALTLAPVAVAVLPNAFCPVAAAPELEAILSFAFLPASPVFLDWP